MKGQIYDMKDFTTAKEKERAILLCERLNSLSLTLKEERPHWPTVRKFNDKIGIRSVQP